MRSSAMLFAVCGGAAALSANAATICVNPAGSGGCQTTIQAAVIAAMAGDVIKIAAGTYREAVIVPAGKDGLILQGGSAKRTIIDPNATANPGLDISSNGVQVIGLGINNAVNNAILVNGADRFVMMKSQVQNAGASCVRLTSGSDNAQFVGNRFFGCGIDAVFAGGDGLVFAKNRVTNADNNGLAVSGDDAEAAGNICENIGGDCVDVFGDNAEISKNSTLASSLRTVRVEGDNALIQANRAVGSGGAVAVDAGDNPQVIKNTAVYSGNPGIEVNCAGGAAMDCGSAQVTGNRVSVTQDGVDCFNLAFAFDGAEVVKNSGQKCNDEGVEIGGAGAALVEANTMSSVGTSDGDAFTVLGAGVKTLRNNRASAAGRDGFRVDEGAHVLEENTAKNNAQNGFFLRVDTNGTQMTGNTATGNGEEGIQNSGDNNVFTDNEAKGNSDGQDFCDSAANATGTVDNGNDFESTTTVCLNE